MDIWRLIKQSEGEYKKAVVGRETVSLKKIALKERPKLRVYSTEHSYVVEIFERHGIRVI